MIKPDSIIFDMDGTLWDGLQVYVESWNRGLKESNLNKIVSRDEIVSMVGWERKAVFDKLLPEYDAAQQESIYDEVCKFPPVLIKELGGHLYDGVKEGLKQLAKDYKLFIVSNCDEGLIEHFMEWAGIEDSITNEIAHGINLMPKHHNIQLLIEKYDLKKPVYVGDTAGDSDQSKLAGVPFVFVSYGFGKTENYSLKFDDFNAFTQYFVSLK